MKVVYSAPAHMSMVVPVVPLKRCEVKAWERWHRATVTGEVLQHKFQHRGLFPVIKGGRHGN